MEWPVKSKWYYEVKLSNQPKKDLEMKTITKLFQMFLALALMVGFFQAMPVKAAGSGPEITFESFSQGISVFSAQVQYSNIMPKNVQWRVGTNPKVFTQTGIKWISCTMRGEARICYTLPKVSGWPFVQFGVVRGTVSFNNTPVVQRFLQYSMGFFPTAGLPPFASTQMVVPESGGGGPALSLQQLYTDGTAEISFTLEQHQYIPEYMFSVNIAALQVTSIYLNKWTACIRHGVGSVCQKIPVRAQSDLRFSVVPGHVWFNNYTQLFAQYGYGFYRK